MPVYATGLLAVDPAAAEVSGASAVGPSARDSLLPLSFALAAGKACFADSRIVPLGPASTRGMRKLSSKLAAIFERMPGAVVGDGGVKHERSGLHFADLTLGQSRRASYLVGCGEAAATPLSPRTPVELVTGICLFGADSVIGWAGPVAYPLTGGRVVHGLDPPRPIDKVTVDTRIHVYEAETLARLVSFIGDFARLHPEAPVLVRAHIPGPEYELTALSLYSRGLLSAETCDRYQRAVRHRARLLSGLLKRSLRGVAEVTVASPLASLIPGLNAGLSPADLPGLAYDAARRRGWLWRALLAGSDPSLETIIFTSYRYHLLAAAREAQRNGHQLMFCENPEEEKLIRFARADADRTGISLGETAGFYVHPRVVVVRSVFGSNRILLDCADGCDGRTVSAALSCYVRGGGRRRPGLLPLAAEGLAWGSVGVCRVSRGSPLIVETL